MKTIAIYLMASAGLFAAGLAQDSATGQPKSINDGYGKALIFTGDFDGDNRSDVLTYYVDTYEWMLRSYNGVGMKRVAVGNTSGFGNLADGRPIWAGNFAGGNQAEVLFYYPGDRNWWLGTLAGGQLTWKLVDNTKGFGQMWPRSPFFMGNFSRTDRTQLLFYYPDDSNWWLGTYDGASLTWTLAGNTAGFGNLTHGQPFLSDDFDGDQHTDVMFYSPGDYNWWLATFSGTQLTWHLVGNTRGFGNLADGRPIWSGDFTGSGRAEVLFYYPGDRNWWLGSLVAGQLSWKLIDNTTGFGQMWPRSPFYLGNFSTSSATEILFFYPDDNNWWLGSATSGNLEWSLAGNTIGFGSGFAAQVKPNAIIGAFSGALDNVLYFSAFDRHLWLGSFKGTSLQWALADEPPPAQPSGLTVANLTALQVTLQWQNPNEAGNTTISTKVERRTSSGQYQEISSLPSDASQFVDNVTPGVTYYYRVRCVDPFDATAYTNEVSALPHLNPPAGLSASEVSPANVLLQWSNSNGPGPGNITIERREDASTTFVQIATLPVNATSSNDTTAVAGHTFTYRVRAVVGSAYTTVYSNEVTITIQPFSALTPSVSSFTDSPSSVQLCLGSPVQLSWQVQNAASVSLSRNGTTLLQRTNPGSLLTWTDSTSDNVTITDPTTPVKYTLTAVNGQKTSAATTSVQSASAWPVVHSILFGNTTEGTVAVWYYTADGYPQQFIGNIASGGTLSVTLPSCMLKRIEVLDADGNWILDTQIILGNDKGRQDYCAIGSACVL